MTVGRRPAIVLLGMMSKMPVAGNMWLVVQYLLGFERLGFDVYYVEAHGITPTKLMAHRDDDGAARAAAFVAGVMDRFGLSDRWAYHSLHDGRHFGLSASRLAALYQSADLLINLHGGTKPLPEHAATGRLVYLETDPVQLQIELHQGDQAALEFLSPHVALFSWGLNYGRPDCRVPQDPRFDFRPTCPPVLLDVWAPYASGPGTSFTTVGNWRQPGQVVLDGETYYWSKDREFLKVLDLPRRTGRPFELALSSRSYRPEDVALLERHGWMVRDSMGFSTDLDAYRAYIAGSRGEFTVAKDQNVRLRSGWFSERSATYLAAGRPVVTQDTGFGAVLPTGEGLFPFSTFDEAARAIEAIDADYERHARAALEIARQYFSHDVVLPAMLDAVGLRAPAPAARPADAAAAMGLPASLDLVPTSRWPTTLPEATVEAVLSCGHPQPPVETGAAGSAVPPRASIVIVCANGLPFTRLCLSSLLAGTRGVPHEVIVVDNGSTDGTAEYLRELATAWRSVRVVRNDRNRGFAAGSNQGLEAAAGDILVLLNNDTVVPPDWLSRLARHLDDDAIGLVGATTNRSGNEAQLEVAYRTLGGFLEFAAEIAARHTGRAFDLRVATMFCAAMRRNVYGQVGPLDERFEVGLFEDDDYSMRVRQAGYRVVCAEDCFVHHFGQASLGETAVAGDYGTLFHTNRQRWEEKWGVPWQSYRQRPGPRYQGMLERIRELVGGRVPAGATVLVVSKGDDALLQLDGRRALHFPRTADGVYSGYHPENGRAAIRLLEEQRAQGAEFLLLPSTALWWLEHYAEFREHLEQQYALVVRDEEGGAIFDVRGARPRSAIGKTRPAIAVTPLDLAGLLLVDLPVYRDERGFFLERFQTATFRELGLPTAFVQDNHSRSLPGVLRGLHYQDGPPQGKLVGVTRGRIWDVAVDIRPESPTFGRSVGIELNDINGRLLWIPGGFAHGFCVLGDEPADLIYKVDTPYNAAREGGIFWADEDLAIRWPIDRPLVSKRDEALPRFAAIRAALAAAR